MPEYLTIEHLTTKELTRFFSKVKVSTERFWNGTPCWEWTAGLTAGGYAKARYRKTNTSGHRIMFSWLVHPLPPGSLQGECDHLCRVTSCVNPIHIEFVSHAVNMERSTAREKASESLSNKPICKNGHARTPDNSLTGKDGIKRCATCRKEAMSRFLSHPSSSEKIKEYRKTSLRNLNECPEKVRRAKERRKEWSAKNSEKIIEQRKRSSQKRRERRALRSKLDDPPE